MLGGIYTVDRVTTLAEHFPHANYDAIDTNYDTNSAIAVMTNGNWCMVSNLIKLTPLEEAML